MQIIHKDKDERTYGRRIDIVDLIIYRERISRCVKEEYFERFRNRPVGI